MQKGKKKIFLIEDDSAISDVMHLVLTEAGHNVIVPDAVQEVFTHIIASKPDIVLMDIHYKGMHMQEVIKTLQTHPTAAQIPIILISADADIEKIAQQTHVAGYLKKPFNIDDLLAIIKNDIER